MLYFIDCEFHEYLKQPKLFGKIPIGNPVPTTELISIALVSEDGRKLYLEADWYDKKAASKHDFLNKEVLPHLKGGSCVKSREEIKKAILEFIADDKEPQLIGWWSSYDWWVLCMEVFGNMTTTMRKTGFWYYSDFKALLNDTLGWDKKDALKLVPMKGTAHNALDDALWLQKVYSKCRTAAQDRLFDDLCNTAHTSLGSLIKHTLSRCVENEDGTYTIPKEKADKWLKRADAKIEELTDSEARTPTNEASKYMRVFQKYNHLLNS